ncbi:MAG: glycosyl hydrolase 115 family protein [Bacteroidales bacterium]
MNRKMHKIPFNTLGKTNDIKVVRNLYYRVFLTIVALLSIYHYSKAQADSTNYISFYPISNGFTLISDKMPVPILLSDDEYSGVKKIASLFQNDIKKVSGHEPRIIYDTIPKSKEIIIIGTIGKSELIEKLILSGKIDVSEIKGKWENSLIVVVDNPFDGVGKALVIVGSDKRGTIYGMLDISRKIGVSPWYWWADVPVQEHNQIYVKPGSYNLGEPKVKYRGIFLNDEEPCLGRWAVEKYGGFNHQFYEKVFELILRLKGNYLWPAMWWAAFNSDDPENAELADEMGIVMSTSHHEPMMRAHSEWTPYRNKGDKWNYALNPEGLKKFWTEGIQRMGEKESVITLAMRGDGDEAMDAGTNISLLEEIVKTQRVIIQSVTGKPLEKVPQVWALYKEVQEYYDRGMRVPDDVTLLLCDDNWGNIRRLPKLDDPKRAGGYGIYYHFDYVGAPRNYKWLNTNQIQRVWEQMNRAYQFGVKQIWLVNVGDLKPMEYPISFFLDFAWNPEVFTAENLIGYSKNWVKEQFGEKNAIQIAEILDLYTKYNSRRKPELLSSETFSLIDYREFETVVNDFNKLVRSAELIYKGIDENQKDAFYQLIFHPVAASANLNEMFYFQALNHLYAGQGRAATNDMAKKVKELFKKDGQIADYYNTKLSDGKWNHMMDQTHISYTYWQQPDSDVVPLVKEIEVPQNAGMGVSIEGSNKFWPDETTKAQLPVYDSYNNQTFYIELFNTGKTPFNYQILTSDKWVKISNPKGKIVQQTRIQISIDWAKLKTGSHLSEMDIKSDKGETVQVVIRANKYDEKLQKPMGFMERNGIISMEAANYTKAIDNKEIKWQVIPGFGRTNSGITTTLVTKSIQKPGGSSPALEYNFYLLENPKDGKIKVNLYLAPALDFHHTGGLKYGISMDGEEPQIINMHQGADVPDYKNPQWWTQAVSDNIIIKSSEHILENPGQHVLKFWLVDPGIVLQKIVIDNGGLKPSYLGPPESIRINN